MNIDYADAILKLRAYLNMSQEEFAKFLGVSFTSVNRWENGIHEPTKLAKVRIQQLIEESNVKIKEVDKNEI
jgi:putative transcriptional regulator